MTDFVLTAERHAELAALLNDEQRLNIEHPKLADYLDTALRLPGTGNDQADSAFDLRLVHHVIGGETETSNPYWDIVAPSVFTHEGCRVVNGGRPDGSARLAYAQIFLQGLYAYAIPSPETIEWASSFCDGRPVVELGAGRGYWAAQLASSALRVDAYDVEPPDKAQNLSFPRAAGLREVWHRVDGADGLAESVADCSDSVLFLCWPPGWGNTMASQALAGFERVGGKRLLFIGEPQGGMTGDDEFFKRLAESWELESQDPRFVSWWNLSDVAQGWVRR